MGADTTDQCVGRCKLFTGKLAVWKRGRQPSVLRRLEIFVRRRTGMICFPVA